MFVDFCFSLCRREGAVNTVDCRVELAVAGFFSFGSRFLDGLRFSDAVDLFFQLLDSRLREVSLGRDFFLLVRIERESSSA